MFVLSSGRVSCERSRHRRCRLSHASGGIVELIEVLRLEAGPAWQQKRQMFGCLLEQVHPRFHRRWNHEKLL